MADACVPDNEEWRLAVLGFFAGLFNFGDRGRKIDFARGVAPFGGRGSSEIIAHASLTSFARLGGRGRPPLRGQLG
jgi:hypothetical protein